MEKILVSVLTPTHNRGGYIDRLYQSLLAQTNHSIEWIIVDDGSTDNTKEVIEQLKSECTLFPIRYYYQENSGKHVALNKLYDLAQGKYCFQIDDDDELLPTAVEDGIKLWRQIENPNKYWCICGRCINNKTRLMVGPAFPPEINNVEGSRKNKLLINISGEKCAIQKTHIVRQYKFPQIADCKFIPESVLWRRIDQDYAQYYTNTVFRVYHQFEGECLSDISVDEKSLINSFHVYRYMLNHDYLRPKKIREYLIWIVFINLAVYKNKHLQNEKYKNLELKDIIALKLTNKISCAIAKHKGWI